MEYLLYTWDFSDSSVGKESVCNAGDPGLIPGLGKSAGEGIGYPLQYSSLENSMDYTNGVTEFLELKRTHTNKNLKAIYPDSIL